MLPPPTLQHQKEREKDLPGARSQVVRPDSSGDVQVGVVNLVQLEAHGQLKNVHRALRHVVRTAAQAAQLLCVVGAHACKLRVG